jgi:hypothetical protein
MSDKSPWYYMRHGDTERGLTNLREAYPREASASVITELGTAYLWSGRYDEAWDHFQKAMLTYRFTMAHFFGRAGAAKWCLGESQTAVEWWEQGMGSQYADAAGGIQLPLLLFVASVLQPESFSRKEAERLLRIKADNPRVGNWPGPLGQFVLGEIDHNCLIEFGKKKSGAMPSERKWLIDFYKMITDLDSEKLTLAGFRQRAKHLVDDLSKPEWTEEREFLHLIWKNEFFIARYEASADTPTTQAET